MKEVAVVDLRYKGLPLTVEFGMKRKVIGSNIRQGRIYSLKKNKELSSGLEKNALTANNVSSMIFEKTDIRTSIVSAASTPTMYMTHSMSTAYDIEGLLDHGLVGKNL